jgi:hypothetical protein
MSMQRWRTHEALKAEGLVVPFNPSVHTSLIFMSHQCAPCQMPTIDLRSHPHCCMSPVAEICQPEIYACTACVTGTAFTEPDHTGLQLLTLQRVIQRMRDGKLNDVKYAKADARIWRQNESVANSSSFQEIAMTSVLWIEYDAFLNLRGRASHARIDGVLLRLPHEQLLLRATVSICQST